MRTASGVNVLDILLLVAAVWFAVIGYRQGFVVGILSVIGFLGGGLIAVYLLPVIWNEITGDATPGTVAAVAAVAIVIVCASVGQALTTHWGNKLRRHITWSPARALDATGGALVNVLAMLLVAWLIGSALAGTSLPTLGKEVRNSKVLLGVSRVMPQQASTWFADFPRSSRRTASRRSSRVRQRADHNVPAPDPALASSPVAAQRPAQHRQGRRHGPRLRQGPRGQRLRLRRHRVMTNAHVVGGVGEPTVQVGGEGRLYDAKVVLYDWQRDIAVLDVPGLEAPPLQFDRQRRERRRQRDRRGLPGERRLRRPGRPYPRPYPGQRPGHLPPRHGHAATSTPSTPRSGRATPAARCSPRTGRSTASSSPSRWTTPTPDTR